MDKATAKIKAVLHPARARILVALNGRPLTPRQVAAYLEDTPLGTVYRHLNILHEAGLIEIVGERRVKGTLERQFALVEAANFLTESDIERLTADDILGLVAALTGAVQAAFHRYTRQADLPIKPGTVAFVAKSLYLTAEEYAEFRQHLIGLFEKARRQPAPEYERRLIGFFSTPDLEIAESAESAEPFQGR